MQRKDMPEALLGKGSPGAQSGRSWRRACWELGAPRVYYCDRRGNLCRNSELRRQCQVEEGKFRIHSSGENAVLHIAPKGPVSLCVVSMILRSIVLVFGRARMLQHLETSILTIL